MVLFQKFFLFASLVLLWMAKRHSSHLQYVLQSIEECLTIKEKVKKYITEQNAHEVAAKSGSSDADAPSTPVTACLGKKRFLIDFSIRSSIQPFWRSERLIESEPGEAMGSLRRLL